MTASPAGKGTSPSVFKGNLRAGADGLKRNVNRKGNNGAIRGKKRGGVRHVHLLGSIWNRM